MIALNARPPAVCGLIIILASGQALLPLQMLATFSVSVIPVSSKMSNKQLIHHCGDVSLVSRCLLVLFGWFGSIDAQSSRVGLDWILVDCSSSPPCGKEQMDDWNLLSPHQQPTLFHFDPSIASVSTPLPRVLPCLPVVFHRLYDTAVPPFFVFFLPMPYLDNHPTLIFVLLLPPPRLVPIPIAHFYKLYWIRNGSGSGTVSEKDAANHTHRVTSSRVERTTKYCEALGVLPLIRWSICVVTRSICVVKVWL